MNIVKTNQIRHSVLCVTYNQEQYIEKAIESLFQGSVVPHEVFVFDDCSVDRTIERLEVLREKYGDVIKVIRNEKNLGVFGNLNQIKTYPTGDIIHLLAGDDWIEPGIFEEMNNIVDRKNLKPIDESFAIVCESYSFKDNSLKKIPLKLREGDALYKAILRREIYYMPVGLSAKYFKNFPNYRLDLGVWADYLHTVCFTKNCSSVYLANKAFPVYREGVGLSSKLSPRNQYISFLKAIDVLMKEHSDILDFKDKLYLKYSVAFYKFLLQKNFLNFTRLLIYISLNIGNGVKLSDLKVLARSFFSDVA